MESIDNNIFFKDWDAFILEILKLKTTEEPELKPLENLLVCIANIQQEKSNLEIWLEGLGGYPVILDQCYSTVNKDRGL